MPAIDEEVAEAEREGVEFRFLEAPVEVREHGGRVSGLSCVRMRLGDVDASGRRRPVPLEGSEFFLPADTVLTAVGEAPEFEHMPADVSHDGWAIAVGELGGTSRRKFFAGGDIIDVPHTVAHALGAGKRAAVGIDRFLRQERGDSWEDVSVESLRLGRMGNASMTRWRGDDPVVRHDPVNQVVPYEDLNPAHFERVTRHADRETWNGNGPRGFQEVNRGLAQEAAWDEAKRCFNCGVCNQCELCLIFCPDVAILRSADGTGFDIAYEYCKGCGICNAECPRGAMVMTREGL
jgi:2-oxoacid:acceptor oxidoreductase delta subunit (pyruvate/2-ketoisovalerate family)